MNQPGEIKQAGASEKQKVKILKSRLLGISRPATERITGHIFVNCWHGTIRAWTTSSEMLAETVKLDDWQE